MATALGVQPDSNGNGVTPEVHRQIIAAQWHNTGVVDGLTVSGRSDLTYNVAAGVAVCSKGTADGMTLAYWPGGQTAAVSAGDASNPRIDLVWINAHNPKMGDSDNSVTVGVTQGTPAANPVAPALPAGCTLLRSMRVPANATATSSATAIDTITYAIPYGASMGLLAYDDQSRINQVINDGGNTVPHLLNRRTISLPTDRLVELDWSGCGTDGNTSDLGNYTSIMHWFKVDGTDVPLAAAELHLMRTWAQFHHNHIMTLTAGAHTIESWYEWRGGNWEISWHYGDDGNQHGGYPGSILAVWDRGVAV